MAKKYIDIDNINRVIKFVPFVQVDRIIQDLSSNLSTLTQNKEKSVVENSSGNKLPREVVKRPGSEIRSQAYKSANSNDSSLKSTIQANNLSMIKEISTDYEVVVNGTTKEVKSMDRGELLHHAIIDKFIIPYTSDGSKKRIFVQPTVYSDAHTYLNYLIETKIKGEISRFGNRREYDVIEDLKERKTLEEKIKYITNLYKSTIGKACNEIKEKNLSKLKKIVGENVNEALWGMTENDLIKMAAEKGVDLEIDQDYKVVKDEEGIEHVTLNPLLQYNADLYQNENGILEDKLKKELFKFAKACENLDVLSFDNMETFYNMAEKFFGMDYDGNLGYEQNWLVGGKNIYSKIKNGEIVVNPLIEIFFFADGFFSENLKLSLTGFETNHSYGKNSEYNLIKNNKISENKYNQNAINIVKETNSINDLIGKISDESIDEETSGYLKDIYKIIRIYG